MKTQDESVRSNCAYVNLRIVHVCQRLHKHVSVLLVIRDDFVDIEWRLFAFTARLGRLSVEGRQCL